MAVKSRPLGMLNCIASDLYLTPQAILRLI